MLKKIISASLAAVMLLACASYSLASDEEAGICLNGDSLDASAYTQDGAVYLPVRAVCSALGYAVAWSSEQGADTVTLTKDSSVVALDFTNRIVTENGHSYSMYFSGQNPCLIRQDRAYLAEELFKQLFGLTAEDGAAVCLKSLTPNAVTFTNMSLESENADLKVTVQYPQIDGLQDGDAQAGINTLLRRAASAAIDRGLQNAYDIRAIKKLYSDYTAQAETYFDYRVTYNANGLLGLVLIDYQYAGGAHGGTVQTGCTFDLKTGAVLKLSDLLNPDSGYTALIDGAIRAEIDARTAAGELAEIQGADFKTIGSDPDFYLSGDSAVIFFQQYEHFPYAAGIQEFPVAYSALSGMLRSAYSFL